MIQVWDSVAVLVSLKMIVMSRILTHCLRFLPPMYQLCLSEGRRRHKCEPIEGNVAILSLHPTIWAVLWQATFGLMLNHTTEKWIQIRSTESE